MKNVSKIILFLSFIFFQSCDSADNNKNKLSKTKESKESLFISKYSYDDHPCLCLVSTKKMPSSNNSLFYSTSKYVDEFSDLDLFSIILESSLMFRHYVEYMDVLESILLRKQIDEYFNPKAYFVKAISDINRSDLVSAIKNLNEFLSLQENYLQNNARYFQLGCYETDIDFIMNFQNTISYKISHDLIKYLSDRENEKDKELLMRTFISDLKSKYDNDNDKIDMIDNIIFSILKLEKIPVSDYGEHINIDKNSNILYSAIHEMFDDGREFFLSSQLEIIALFKYYQAKELYEGFDWEKINKNLVNTDSRAPFPEWDIDTKHLYSLMHLYEFELEFLGFSNSRLYNDIKMIINHMGYQNCDGWLDSYSDENKFIYSNIGKLVNQFKNGVSLPNLTQIIDLISEDVYADSARYFKVRDLLVDKIVFDSISTDTINFIVQKPVDRYKTMIDDFLALSSNFDYPRAFIFQVQSPVNFYSIFNMNNTNKSISVSENLSADKVINEGSLPVSAYWSFLRGYFEIDNSGENKNKCKN